ncbi:ead/Ea22-like family protein [Enterobacter kobei]|uniref:ead/Ea22-like family protein n=1 Tax=Enterobacter kobei TaxID=208224 RepID=UPI002149E7B7|nr:ead/Ea22-like family protein [Enterobacter kobei]MCR2796161.1 ead/Ea22-like family protein [Enterobacter kobei]
MSDIDKRALLESAESTINILENIAGFEPSDIDGDTVELRFETEDGFDTGCDVSIVDQCQKAADVVQALLDDLEAAEKRIAELKRKEQHGDNQMTTFTKGELILIASTGIVRTDDASNLANYALALLDDLEAAEKRIAELERKEQHSERQSVIDALAGSGEEWSDIEEYMQKWDAERASAAGKGE